MATSYAYLVRIPLTHSSDASMYACIVRIHRPHTSYSSIVRIPRIPSTHCSYAFPVRIPRTHTSFTDLVAVAGSKSCLFSCQSAKEELAFHNLVANAKKAQPLVVGHNLLTMKAPAFFWWMPDGCLVTLRNTKSAKMRSLTSHSVSMQNA